MRILIVHHGRLPVPGRATTGGALRAWHHARALQRAGHEVTCLTRAQDAPGGFEGPADLLRRARALAPERVVCVQPEEAPALAPLGVPMAVDLYAPRLLEAPFEGSLVQAATDSLRALAAGSVFLVSNPRQRWAWLSVLALAGVDIRTDPTLHVPLVAPQGPPRSPPPPEAPVLVAGGAAWPWQDPRPALLRILAHLDRRGAGEVVWLGGPPLIGPGVAAWSLPEHPRLRAPGWLGYDEVLARYASATAAVDWMGNSPERALALSFRHMDYLGCGLPILTGPDSALAEVLGEAGWTTDDIEGALDATLDDPEGLERRSEAALRLARGRFSPEVAEAPLLTWIEEGREHPRARGPLVDAAAWAAEAAAERTRREAAEQALATHAEEVLRKREEAERLVGQVQQLTGVVERLTRAIDEVAGFKREAIQVLGGEATRAQRSLEDAEREIRILRADLAKKSAELVAKDELRERLESDLHHLRAELERARQPRRRGILS